MSHFPCQPQDSCTFKEKKNLQGFARVGLGNDILTLHSCNTSMTCALEIHSESFYLFIILLFTTSNDSEKSKCLTLVLTKYKVHGEELLLLNCLDSRATQLKLLNISGMNTQFYTEYQRTFTFQQMPSHCPSFDKHFSFLSKH